MSSLEKALEMWVKTLIKVWGQLTRPIYKWSPAAWDIVKDIHNTLLIFASALVVVIFLYGLFKKTANLTDLKRPEFIFSSFIKLALAETVVGVSMRLMLGLFDIVQGMIAAIHRASSVNFEGMQIPDEIAGALDEFSMTKVKVWLLGLVAMFVIFVMSIMLIVTVWGRYANIYIHIAVSGLFLAFFAAEETQHIATSYLKSAANAAFRGAIIGLALLIYSAIMSEGSLMDVGLTAAASDDSAGMLMDYMYRFLVGGFVTLGICKTGDQISQRMGL